MGGPAYNLDNAVAQPVPGLQGMCMVLDRMMAAAAGTPSTPETAIYEGPTVRPGTLVNPLRLFNEHVKCNPAVYMHAMVLLDRSGIPPTCNLLQHLLMVCVVVSIKALDDHHYTNKGYAQLFGVPTEQLNAIEAAFLTRIQWGAYVDETTYTTMLSTCLEEERAVGVCSTPPTTPRAFSRTKFVVTRSSAQESIGILFKDARIVGVVPHGASYHAGLQRDMLIKSINGVPVAQHYQVAQAIATAPASFTIEIHPGSAALQLPCVAAPPRAPQPLAFTPQNTPPHGPASPGHMQAAGPVVYVLTPPGVQQVVAAPVAVPCGYAPAVYAAPPMAAVPQMVAVPQGWPQQGY